MTLDEIKARCEEVGDCLEWTGYFERGNPRSAGRSVRFTVYELVNGPVAKDRTKVVTVKCGNPKCVNPDHLIRTTKSVVAKRVGSLGLTQKRRISEGRRKQSTLLTMEIAREVRESTLPAKEEAKLRGISWHMVYKIRAHQAWREYDSNPFVGLMS